MLAHFGPGQQDSALAELTHGYAYKWRRVTGLQQCGSYHGCKPRDSSQDRLCGAPAGYGRACAVACHSITSSHHMPGASGEHHTDSVADGMECPTAATRSGCKSFGRHSPATIAPYHMSLEYRDWHACRPRMEMSPVSKRQCPSGESAAQPLGTVGSASLEARSAAGSAASAGGTPRRADDGAAAAPQLARPAARQRELDSEARSPVGPAQLCAGPQRLEILPVHRPVQSSQPVARPILRPVRQRQFRLALPATPQATPQPLLCPSHHLRPHRVGLYIPEDSQEVVVILHPETLEAALVHVPAPRAAMLGMIAPHMGHPHPTQEPPNRLIRPQPDQQMPVVGHQAVGEQLHRLALQALNENLLRIRVLRSILEELHAGVPAVQDVVDQPGFYGSGGSWYASHSRRLSPRPSITSHVPDARPNPGTLSTPRGECYRRTRSSYIDHLYMPFHQQPPSPAYRHLPLFTV